jgi:hypothetical protein
MKQRYLNRNLTLLFIGTCLLVSSLARAESYDCKVTDIDGKKTGEEVTFSFEPRWVKLKPAAGEPEVTLLESGKVILPAPLNLDHATISLANMPESKSFDWHFKQQAEGHLNLDLGEMSGDFSSSHTSFGGLKIKSFSFTECKAQK